MLSWSMRGLGSKDAEVRRAAVVRLGNRGKPDAIPPLAAILEKDTDYRLREAAGEALVKCGPAALPALLSALQTIDNQQVRGVTARMLGRLGDRGAIPALVASLDEDWATARDAAESLRLLGWSPAAVNDQIRLALARGDDETLAALAPKGVDALLDVLRTSKDESHLRSAAEALGAGGDVRAVPALVAALAGQTRSVGTAAANALSHLHWAPSTLAESLHYAEARGDVQGLVQLGMAAVRALVRLTKYVERVACEATLALGRLGGDEAIAALQERLDAWPIRNNSDEKLRDAAIQALLESTDPRAAEILIAAMKTVGPLKRGGPLRHLMSDTTKKMAARSGSAREAVISALQSDDDSLRTAAAVALAEAGWTPESSDTQLSILVEAQRWDDVIQLGSASAAPLSRILGDTTNSAPGLRRRIVESLGRGGADWCHDPLIGALRDPVYAVRKAAANALSTLGVPPREMAGGTTVDVKPTPGECAVCGVPLNKRGSADVFRDYAIGRAAAAGNLEAADAMMATAHECQGCGLPLCYSCFKFATCPDCGRESPSI